jgi:cytoskeletal protein CcmA (bactofilin family)
MAGVWLGESQHESLMSQPAESANRRVSLLGPNSVLNGDFATTEELVVLGQMIGERLLAPNITIGPSGRVTADIYADTIRIEGAITGNVYAQTATILGASAIVSGSINSPNVTIREGAIVNGAVNPSPAPAVPKLDEFAREVRLRVTGSAV